jgi:hypothetical protein
MENLLTEDETAKALSLSPRTLEGFRLKGGGPKFVKLGHRVAYRPADVEAYVAANVRTSTSDQRSAAR